MAALTAGRLARLFGSQSMNTGVSFAPSSPCFTCTAFLTIPSPPTWWPPPSLSHATPQRSGRPASAGSDFASLGQARRFHTAESGSSSYGLVIHLPLLRTPSRDDALTFSYRPESACLKRTLTSLTMHAHRRTQVGLRRLPQAPRDDGAGRAHAGGLSASCCRGFNRRGGGAVHGLSKPAPSLVGSLRTIGSVGCVAGLRCESRIVMLFAVGSGRAARGGQTESAV
jgi:hypothetical protein